MSNSPKRANRPCSFSSCGEYATNQGYCDKHQHRIRVKDRERGTSHQRGYDAKWREARAEHLAEQPLCADHLRRGYYETATVVDHITAHKGDSELFWNRNNWQSLCKSCHDRKTQLQDRGAWVPKPPNYKEPEPETNPFQAGDKVRPNSGYAADVLSASMKHQFTVITVIDQDIEVHDLDGFSCTMHHSNFKAVA